MFNTHRDRVSRVWLPRPVLHWNCKCFQFTHPSIFRWYACIRWEIIVSKRIKCEKYSNSCIQRPKAFQKIPCWTTRMYFFWCRLVNKTTSTIIIIFNQFHWHFDSFAFSLCSRNMNKILAVDFSIEERAAKYFSTCITHLTFPIVRCVVFSPVFNRFL